MNRLTWMKFAGLIFLTAGIYWPVSHYGLINLDDITYLYENPYIKSGLTLAGLRDAFVHTRFANYAPLVSISYYIDQTLFQLRPGPMHVENVLLHLITAMLLWRLIFICTGYSGRSFAVAALFLCHPMHVESVAWLSERKDVLSTPLLIGAMIAYVRYCTQQGREQKQIAYVCMMVLYTSSLLAKSMGVTLPAVLLLMDFWPLRRWTVRSWTYLCIEKLPVLAISIIFSALAALAQRSGGAVESLGRLTLSTRFENAVICYVIYIAKLLVPTNLAVFYPHPMTRPLGAAVAAGGLLLLITVLFYRARNSRPYLITGWCWFIATLLPVIGLIQLGAQAMADRYIYFPSIGLSITLVWWIGQHIKSTAIQSWVLAITVLVLSIIAHRQVTYWKDTQTLFTHALDVTDDSFLPHDELGSVYLARGDLYHAIEQYRQALNFGQDPRANHDLGKCYRDIDRSKSVFYYRTAVELLPRSVNYRTDLAVALRLDGDLSEAKKQVEIAISINPDYAEAHAEMVRILAELRHQP